MAIYRPNVTAVASIPASCAMAKRHFGFRDANEVARFLLRAIEQAGDTTSVAASGARTAG